MKKAELVLSELANRYGVKHGSADSAESIGEGIAKHVDSLKPLALSERETKIVSGARETKIDLLLAEGKINPAQVKVLKTAFASKDLVLSEGNQDPFELSEKAFEAMVSFASAGTNKVPEKERTEAQELQLAEGDDGNDNTPNPVKTAIDNLVSK